MVLRFVALAALAAIVWFTRDGAAEGQETVIPDTGGQQGVVGLEPRSSIPNAPKAPLTPLPEPGAVVGASDAQSGGSDAPVVVQESTDEQVGVTREQGARDFSDFQEDTLSASELGLDEDEGDVSGFVPTSGTGL